MCAKPNGVHKRCAHLLAAAAASALVRAESIKPNADRIIDALRIVCKYEFSMSFDRVPESRLRFDCLHLAAGRRSRSPIAIRKALASETE